MEKYLAPETAARMAAAAATFREALDEAQRSVLDNEFKSDGVRRDWSYLPQPERDGPAGPADRARQHAGRREPRAVGVAEPGERLR